MNIAVIGTRGVPNHYGGFEQFAEYLSAGLVQKGHSVTVYNSHTHPYQRNEWKGVRIVHCTDPEDKYGTIGQFIYDLNCIRHVRTQQYDIILQLGYTSGSVWGWLLPRKNSIVTTNMDGLEWKRTKYSKPVRRFLQYAEKLGVKYSDHLISDSVGIQDYLSEKYKKSSVFIPYGANLFTEADSTRLGNYDLIPFQYSLLIARLEPENSIETILDGVVMSGKKEPFLVIGKHQTKFGEYLKAKFALSPQIKFVGGIYDINILNNLRHFSNLYFHGHTVGGTNPSLLEAMASQSLICANNNIFNRSILEGDAFYFNNATEVSTLLLGQQKTGNAGKIKANEEKVKNIYAWPIIVQQYLEHFEMILKVKNFTGSGSVRRAINTQPVTAAIKTEF